MKKLFIGLLVLGILVIGVLGFTNSDLLAKTDRRKLLPKKPRFRPAVWIMTPSMPSMRRRRSS